MTGRLRISLASTLLVGLAAGHARADDRSAADFFRAASAAYARGDYRAAATAFEGAFREAPRAAARYNAGLAWELAREPARAADAYASALELREGITDAQTRDARTRLAKLEKSLARLEVRAPAGASISVDGGESVATTTVHVAPGEHRVSVTAPGGSAEERTVRVAAGGQRTVSFAEPEEIPDRAQPPALPRRTAPAPPEPEGGNSALTTGGWIALGCGVALGATVVGLGVSALNAKAEFDEDQTQTEPHDRAASLRLWTNVALVGAVVAGAGGVTLLVLAPPSRPGRAAALRVRIGPGSLGIAGTL